MVRKRNSLSIEDLRSKPTVLCLAFLVIYYSKRYRDRRKLRESSERAIGRLTCDFTENVTHLQIAYKQGLVDKRICHCSPERFDQDFHKFAKFKSSFGKELSALLGIIIPNYKSRAIRLLILHMAMLGLRTYMSLLVADLDGRIVRHLIGANGPAFVASLMEWLILAVPASYTNAMIKYLEGKISLEFRSTMVRYIHDLYLGANKEYYKVSSIDGALQGIDHYITSDVTKFCNAAAKLYSNLGKPSLDLVIFAVQLSRNLGRKTLAGIFLNYIITAAILRQFSPAFGSLAAQEAQLEGDYRNAHSRVITNAEEIAFYDGASIEKLSLGESYQSLVKHIGKVLRVKALYSIMEGYVLKYSWSASGFLFASVPVFFPASRGSSVNVITPANKDERENMGKFVTNKRIMLSISDAGGRIMYSIKDMAELAGYTRRVYQLIAALHRVRNNAYRLHKDRRVDEKQENGHSIGESSDSYTLADVEGKLEISETSEIVSFEKVPVIVPGSGVEMSKGEAILDPLTFEVRPGQHLLIIGSNGSGKSSIARLAAGLWPIYRGLLQKSSKVAFLPQRPYFSSGTLRDQIIYPQTRDSLIHNSVQDSDLLRILRRVHIEYLPEREGGFDVTKEWKDVLSGGEKQRMLFARLLFAKPKFAIIDEGTSAVSADMEGLLYEECKADGITLITISHRLSLLKYHGIKLEVGLGEDGADWSLENTAHQQGWSSMDKEIEDIQSFLSKVPALEKRRREVLELLRT